MKHKGAWIYFGMAVALLASLQPLRFAWHLGLAAYHRIDNPDSSADHMHSAIRIHAPAYRYFKKYYGGAIDHRIAHDVIYSRFRYRRSPAQSLDGSIMTEKRFLQNYRENVYVHYLFSPDPEFARFGQWQNLDPVSLRLLADPEANPISEAILTQLQKSVQPQFPIILAGYLEWVNNDKLAARVRAIYHLPPPTPVPEFNETQSHHRLIAFLKSRGVFPQDQLEDNIITNGAFDDISAYRGQWNLSVMAGPPHFSDGSFIAGPEAGAKEGGWMRIFGFYTSAKPETAAPRGGAWFRNPVCLSEGYFVFAFDYFTLTGAEKPSFFLSRGASENYLPSGAGLWRTAVLLINNSSQDAPFIKPLIRMWGTGCMFVDNVRLIQAPTVRKTIPRTGRLWIISPSPEDDKTGTAAVLSQAEDNPRGQKH